MQNSFLNIHDAILLLTAVECVFLAVLLKVLPAKRIQPRFFLIAFFMVMAVNLIAIVIVWNEKLIQLSINQAPIVVSLLVASILVKGPVLFFYLRSLSQSINILQWKNIIHLVPVLLALFVVNFFNINSADWQKSPVVFGLEENAVSAVWLMVKLLPLIYVLASILAEYKLRENLKQVYSHISVTELKLADMILLGFCVHWMWSLISYVFQDYLDYSLRDTMGIINNYFTVVLINGLFVFGLINTRQLLSDAINEPIEVLPDSSLKPKIAAIEDGIHVKKLFLESTINLDRFSEKIGLRPRDTSIVINSHYKSTFLEFINHYRVEEAKRLLTAPEHRFETIQGVIEKSGFNSSSAFHRFFKRMVGVTPTEYRKRATGTTPGN